MASKATPEPARKKEKKNRERKRDHSLNERKKEREREKGTKRLKFYGLYRKLLKCVWEEGWKLTARPNRGWAGARSSPPKVPCSGWGVTAVTSSGEVHTQAAREDAFQRSSVWACSV